MSFLPTEWGRLVILLLVVGLLWRTSLFTASAQVEELCAGDFISVSPPLTEIGQGEYIRLDEGPTGFRGGLYPDGANERPPEHERAGLLAAQRIQPLDEAGWPAANGQIVMVSVGMSNTNSEFGAFQEMIHRNPAVNPRLTTVNGAQGGRVADRWSDPNDSPWPELDSRLERSGVAPQQVQVAWMKQTLTRGGDFPEKAAALEEHLEAIVVNLKTRYPNLQIVYLSSRTRSYTYWRGLSPEPVAFETGFAVKWLVERQINGDPALNFDPARGEATAPYLSWGPYLWIDGQNPRADGRTWTQAEMTQDCTHPSTSGNQIAAEMLYDFFSTDTTAVSWFLADQASPPTPPARAAPPSSELTERPATVTTAMTPASPATLPLTAAIGTATPALPTAGSPTGQTLPTTSILILAALLGAVIMAMGWLALRRQ